MEWHGFFLIEFTITLTAAQVAKLKAALEKMGRQSDPQPARITFARLRLDGQAAIVEVVLSAQVTKGDVVAALTGGLSLPVVFLNGVVTITVFAGVDWEERRAACEAYLHANAAAWDLPGA